MTEAKTNTQDTTKAMSENEKKALATHCRTITNFNKQIFKAGGALEAICANRLYRETHKTFEAFVVDKFDMGRHQAYRLIHAYNVVSVLAEAGFSEVPTVESQCRPFSGLILDTDKEENDTDKLCELWEKILDAKKDQKASRVTAALINGVLNPKKEKEDPKKSTGSGDTSGESAGSDAGESTGGADNTTAGKSPQELALEAEVRALKAQLETTKKKLTLAENTIRTMKRGARSTFEGGPLWRDFMKSGYTAMSKKHHPDITGGDETTMKRVNEIWADLQKTM